AYLLQGLIRCGSCGHRMSPQPGTSRTGRLHPYYSCGYAEKSRGTSCPFRYVPAEAADQAVLEFLKQLHLKPELVNAFAERANEFASETLAKLRADLERVKEPLSVVRTKIANMVEAVAMGGRTAMASLKDKLEALEVEKAELESTEARLKAEIQAEQTTLFAERSQREWLNSRNSLA
ncbi:MAG: recombinase zinc beta ribbon domain-containing protein, partial [Candidatus Methylomirabilales bacterium]